MSRIACSPSSCSRSSRRPARPRSSCRSRKPARSWMRLARPCRPGSPAGRTRGSPRPGRAGSGSATAPSASGSSGARRTPSSTCCSSARRSRRLPGSRARPRPAWRRGEAEQTLAQRLQDLVAALASPGHDERLVLSRSLLDRLGLPVGTPKRTRSRDRVAARERRAGAAGAGGLRGRAREGARPAGRDGAAGRALHALPRARDRPRHLAAARLRPRRGPARRARARPPDRRLASAGSRSWARASTSWRRPRARTSTRRSRCRRSPWPTRWCAWACRAPRASRSPPSTSARACSTTWRGPARGRRPARDTSCSFPGRARDGRRRSWPTGSGSATRSPARPKR